MAAMELGRADVGKKLMEKYMERNMPVVPLIVAHGKSFQTSPEKHKRLIMEIIDEYGPRFAPGGIILYVGDSGKNQDSLTKQVLLRLD